MKIFLVDYESMGINDHSRCFLRDQETVTLA